MNILGRNSAQDTILYCACFLLKRYTILHHRENPQLVGDALLTRAPIKGGGKWILGVGYILNVNCPFLRKLLVINAVSNANISSEIRLEFFAERIIGL